MSIPVANNTILLAFQPLGECSKLKLRALHTHDLPPSLLFANLTIPPPSTTTFNPPNPANSACLPQTTTTYTLTSTHNPHKMKLSIAAIVGALVATVCAKPAFTNLDFSLTEGTPFTLEWVNATGPVTITLVSGADSKTLVPVQTLTSTATGTSFTYTPSGLPSGNYAFRINDATSVNDPNFSMLIVYVGTGKASSSSALTSAATTASSGSVTSTVTSAATTETTGTTLTSKPLLSLPPWPGA